METYGLDNLRLTVAKLLGNAGVVSWMAQHKLEYPNRIPEHR